MRALVHFSRTLHVTHDAASETIVTTTAITVIAVVFAEVPRPGVRAFGLTRVAEAATGRYTVAVVAQVMFTGCVKY